MFIHFVSKWYLSVLDNVISCGAPLKTNGISNADVTFSINFSSCQAQQTIGWFISVYSLHFSKAPAGKKAVFKKN